MRGNSGSANVSHARLDGSEQLIFGFDGVAPQPQSGLDLWRDARRLEMEKLAATTGLSIGHRVRVTLASGPVVEGRLLVGADELWLHARRPDELRLRIGAVDFYAAEIESCVRLDADD
jgi:hypothetical protein